MVQAFAPMQSMTTRFFCGLVNVLQAFAGLLIPVGSAAVHCLTGAELPRCRISSPFFVLSTTRLMARLYCSFKITKNNNLVYFKKIGLSFLTV